MDQRRGKVSQAHAYLSHSDVIEEGRRSCSPTNEYWPEQVLSRSVHRRRCKSPLAGGSQGRLECASSREFITELLDRLQHGAPRHDPRRAGRNPSRSLSRSPDPFKVSPRPSMLSIEVDTIIEDTKEPDEHDHYCRTRYNMHSPTTLMEREPEMPPAPRAELLPLAPSSSGGSVQSLIQEEHPHSDTWGLESSMSFMVLAPSPNMYTARPAFHSDQVYQHASPSYHNILGITSHPEQSLRPTQHHTGGAPVDGSYFAPPRSPRHSPAPAFPTSISSGISSQAQYRYEAPSVLPVIPDMQFMMSTQNVQMVCVASGMSGGRADWQADGRGGTVQTLSVHGNSTSVRVTTHSNAPRSTHH